ncbi:MAG: hypothetical protein JXB05_19200 [Myxococcaceae bacterium]|nr:hypothetical protein [Myxococcaceae bacterium]
MSISMKSGSWQLAAVLLFLSLQGTAFASETTHTRWGTWYGTHNGPWYSAMCAPGTVAVGLWGRSGSAIDQLNLKCAPAIAVGQLGATYYAGGGGGDGGGWFDLDCAPGYAISTIYGRYASLLDSIGIVCRSLDWGYSYTGPSTGGTGGTPFWDYAQPGEFVTGIRGRIATNTGVGGLVGSVSVSYSVISRW